MEKFCVERVLGGCDSGKTLWEIEILQVTLGRCGTWVMACCRQTPQRSGGEGAAKGVETPCHRPAPTRHEGIGIERPGRLGGQISCASDGTAGPSRRRPQAQTGGAAPPPRLRRALERGRACALEARPCRVSLTARHSARNRQSQPRGQPAPACRARQAKPAAANPVHGMPCACSCCRRRRRACSPSGASRRPSVDAPKRRPTPARLQSPRTLGSKSHCRRDWLAGVPPALAARPPANRRGVTATHESHFRAERTP